MKRKLKKFHQYQQSEQPPLTLTYGERKPTAYGVGNLILA
jgi:hypothetical protein